jgi:hypothetical protein
MPIMSVNPGRAPIPVDPQTPGRAPIPVDPPGSVAGGANGGDRPSGPIAPPSGLPVVPADGVDDPGRSHGHDGGTSPGNIFKP